MRRAPARHRGSVPRASITFYHCPGRATATVATEQSASFQENLCQSRQPRRKPPRWQERCCRPSLRRGGGPDFPGAVRHLKDHVVGGDRLPAIGKGAVVAGLEAAEEPSNGRFDAIRFGGIKKAHKLGSGRANKDRGRMRPATEGGCVDGSNGRGDLASPSGRAAAGGGRPDGRTTAVVVH